MQPTSRRLDDVEIKELTELARRATTPSAVARRAALVLAFDLAMVSATPAAQLPPTARKWFWRYLESGGAGLRDRPRGGRPSEAVDDPNRILLAPLTQVSTRWTSRSIARDLGVSQARVARVWTDAFDLDATTTTTTTTLPAGLTLTGLVVSRAGSMLLFETKPEGQPTRFSENDAMRAPGRRAIQTILAAELKVQEQATDDAQVSARLQAAPWTSVDLILTTDVALGAVARAQHTAAQLVVVDRAGWQRLLKTLAARLTTDGLPDLASAEDAVRRWARQDATTAALTWRPTHLGPPPSPSETATVNRPQTGPVLAALIQAAGSGRLTASERVTESLVARTAQVTRGQARDAIKLLVSQALLVRTDDGHVTLPRPEPDDIVETYATRRALGALAVRRAATRPPAALLPDLAGALDDMLRTSSSGNAIATGDLDLTFQDTLVAGCGMRRVPGMFSILTDQLRLFVAVLQVRYSYPIAAMCADNTELLELVSRGSADAAVAKWNSKINESATFMLRQLESPPRRSPQTPHH